MFAAVADLGYKNIHDQNGAFGDGYFPIAISNIDNHRVSTAMAYLTREVRQRPNLDDHERRARGAAAVRRHARHRRARAAAAARLIDISARETIVSMGALHSPAFLMRNGIGPATELAALGIAVVADRAGVGKHLMEHPGVNFGCYLKPEARLPAEHAAADVRGPALVVEARRLSGGRHVHHPEQQGGVARASATGSACS